MAGISLRDVSKSFGDLVAVNNVTLDINKGEFFTLLGPSGCGKTTLLRCIAGFAEPEQGQIFFDEHRVDGIPIHKREVGMVFQNYAVFPHLSVLDNVKYGLKARKVSVHEQSDRARKALALVQLQGLGHRLPNELSGGQLQRVAIARALVIEPEVFLLDEPLSNLDAKLRIEMRGEIRALQQKMGITTIYVTHDQEEALSISDRIAVINHGIIHQIGKPWEVYTQPADSFVAGFIGATNMLQGEMAESTGDIPIARCGELKLGLSQSYKTDPGTPLQIAIRPEVISIADKEETVPKGHWPVEGRIARIEYLGNMIKYLVGFSEDLKLSVTSYNTDPSKIRDVGEQVTIFYPVDRAWAFQKD